jgi:hypothetical protein
MVPKLQFPTKKGLCLQAQFAGWECGARWELFYVHIRQPISNTYSN